jgi:hypothetical protein
LEAWDVDFAGRACVTADRNGRRSVASIKKTEIKAATNIAALRETQGFSVIPNNKDSIADGSQGSTTMRPSRSASPSTPSLLGKDLQASSYHRRTKKTVCRCYITANAPNVGGAG